VRVTMTFLCIFAVGAASAQSPAPRPVEEPEFQGVVYSVHSDSGMLGLLEKAPAVPSIRLRGLGLGGIKLSFTVDGAASSVRFSSAQIPSFVMRVENQSADPSDSVQLYKMAPDDKHRKLAYTSMSAFGQKVQAAEAKVQLEFNKYATTSIRISTPKLALGEYCFNTTDTRPQLGETQIRTVYCFGVD